MKAERLGSTRVTVTFLGYKSTSSKRLVGKLAIEDIAARQGFAVSGGTSSAAFAF